MAMWATIENIAIYAIIGVALLFAPQPANLASLLLLLFVNFPRRG